MLDEYVDTPWTGIGRAVGSIKALECPVYGCMQKGHPRWVALFGCCRLRGYSRSLRFQFSRSPSVVLEDELEEELEEPPFEGAL